MTTATATATDTVPTYKTPESVPEGVPEGFKPRHLGDGYVANNGPLYTRLHNGVLQMGFRVEHRHTNPMGICHGGMMATFCDMLLPISAQFVSPEAKNRFLPTINLQLDYLAPSPQGAWVQGEAQVLKVTRSMVFMQGLVTADGKLAVRCSGIMKIGPAFDSASFKAAALKTAAQQSATQNAHKN